MVSKKKNKSSTKKASSKKSVSKKTPIKTVSNKPKIKDLKKSKFTSNKKPNKRSTTKPKETVRVKTFIVEKPVYVTAPEKKSLPAKARHPDYFRMLDAKKSRYSKESLEPNYSDDVFDSSEESTEDISDENEFRDFPEENELDPNYEDDEFGQEKDSDFESEKPIHPRSRALFTGEWWKRAFWQAAAVWLAIFIFAFFMDFINLSTVELQRNWVFLFIGLFVVMLVYQKFLKGKLIK